MNKFKENISKISKILNTDLSKKLNLLDLSISFKELALLLKSNITTAESVNILTTTAPSTKLQNIFKEIYRGLLNGNNLYTSFENTKKFDKFLITLIKSGENSENLYEVFIYLSDYYEKKYRLNQKIVSILAYPIVLIFVTFSVLIFLLTNVIPMFIDIFEESSVELPSITRNLILIVRFLERNYINISVFLVIFVILILILRKTEKFRMVTSKFLFNIPYIKKHYQNYITSIVARNLTILLSGNINVVDSLEIIKDSNRNLYLKKHIENSIVKIKSGNSISSSLGNSKIFNNAFINMIKVGEDSEKIVEILKGATEYYDQKISFSIDKMLQMLQPIIILIISSFVAFIVFSIAIPMFDLSNSINF